MRLTENQIIDELTIEEKMFFPLKVIQIDRELSLTDNYRIDAVIRFSIEEGPSFDAAVELLSISTPKMISQKSKVLGSIASRLRNEKLAPMIVAPFISKKESKKPNIIVYCGIVFDF